jgi:hypothetical protein
MTYRLLEKARTVGEATVLRDVLRAQNIAAELRGEHRPSIAGELPIPESQVEVWVPEPDLATAKSVLARNEALEHQPPRQCAHCHEESPSQFEVCWKCEQPFPTRPGEIS